jgi:hypothetical protein
MRANILGSSLFLAIIASLYQPCNAASKPQFVIKCYPYPKADGTKANGAYEACNNMCFAIYKAGQPYTLTYTGTTRDTDKGCKAGMTPGGKTGQSPCTTGNSRYAGHPGNSCDEYPLARTGKERQQYKKGLRANQHNLLFCSSQLPWRSTNLTMCATSR